jgi:RsiW-degrading membrane proteinase PrsW (M82 family)
MQTDATNEGVAGERHVCCVCGEPVSPPYTMIAQRIYCDHHFAVVNKPHRGFWRSALVQIAVMGLFSAIVILLDSYIGPLEDASRIAVGLVLVLVPSALWLYYFYRQDRLEAEPKTRVLQVFFLALLLTEAIGYKLVYDWFAVREWASSLNLASLLASILIGGFIWQVITYIAVRVVVYATPEFDERMDGIVYGTIAGLGVATVLNLHYVLDNGGVALGPGVVSIVTTALAQASFGGLLGYFMAEAKFEHKPVWWVPLGLVITATLNGLFGWLLIEVSADGLSVAPWRSLVLGLVVAMAAFGVLLLLMRRATEVTLSRPTG